MKKPLRPSLRRAGHAGHVLASDATGLAGRMSRPIRLAFLGAGSFFAPRLVNDVIRIPGNRGGTIALVDIDARRLEITRRLIRRLLDRHGRGRWQVVAATDRRTVLRDTDYVVNCIEVNGVACVEPDNDIPLKYGVDQCIGDTIGPGGLFKALRTIPVWIDVLRDCERLCPRALVLNYTNPMGMLCLAAARTSSMRVVGLCHSVQNTIRLLAGYAGTPLAEIAWTCAGINHLAWFTRLEREGRDLYPDLRRKFRADLASADREFAAGLALADSRDDSHGTSAGAAYRESDLVRKDMCLHFGAFITESSGHLSEYLPYYRKSPAGRRKLRLAYHGGSRFYATNWPKWRAAEDTQRQAMLRGKLPMDWPRSTEYASWIIEAVEKNAPYVFHGNVPNCADDAGPLISNLARDGCVEVACLADANGVQPTRYGPLPPQMAALCRSNLDMIDLAARAAVARSIETATHALLVDPLTAAVCAPAEITAMAREMFRAERRFLPGYR